MGSASEQVTLSESVERLYRDKSWLYEQYWGKLKNQREIGESIGVDGSRISYWMRKHGIPRRGKAQQHELHDHPDPPTWSGADHPQYKNRAYFYTIDGYEKWESRYAGKQYQVPVHRLVAVAEWGIEAVKGNEVHHKNGIRWDNRPENLEVLDSIAHKRRPKHPR